MFDQRALFHFWLTGLISILYVGGGLLGIGTVAAVVIGLWAVMVGMTVESTMMVLAFGSPLWAPLGAAIGLMATNAYLGYVFVGRERLGRGTDTRQAR